MSRTMLADPRTPGYSGFILPANTIGLIVAELGPSTHAIWLALSFQAGSAVGFLLLGRLSDIVSLLQNISTSSPRLRSNSKSVRTKMALYWLFDNGCGRQHHRRNGTQC